MTRRVCQLMLDRGGATHVGPRPDCMGRIVVRRRLVARLAPSPLRGWGTPTSAPVWGRIVVGRHGKMEIVLITGFPAGLLQCNCYVLAPHPGADAIIVDPGQRAMGQLRRILDKNRLTPAAVLLTHGHIDHIWSAQKVSDTFGCPAYIHPEDRFMLTDPIKDFGPKLGQLLLRRDIPRAQTGRRTRSRRRQDRPRRDQRHRRPHARPHPWIGGLPSQGRQGR